MVELIWDGKYDESGKRAAPLRLKLPFQTVETVNASAQQRQIALDLFSAGRPAEWRNRLIWGDKKYVLPALLEEFAGQVDLIYIDPPFATGADFSFQVEVDNESFTREASIIEQKAYRDTWGRGLDSYLQWIYETFILLHELLAEDGSIYVHVGWQVSSFVKNVLDEVFGVDNLRNEIIWQRFNFHADAKRFGTVHETIWYYVKSEEAAFTRLYLPVKKSLINSHYTNVDENGRRYTLDNPTAPAHGKTGKPMRFGDRMIEPPTGAMWRYSQDNIDTLWTEGKIVLNEAGMPRIKRYLDEVEGTAVHSIWTDIRAINSQAHERTGYPTQKPEALIYRILNASSKEGNLVFDSFCGSGTTAAVAEKLNRRWIACDLGRFAIHTTRKRLLGIPGVRPFVVQNLGKYERQAWQVAEFGGDENAAAVVRQYRHFILDLYHARPVDGYTWLHGLKDGRMVHVGPVDSPISPNDVKQIAIEFRKAVGTGQDAPSQAAVDVLGLGFRLRAERGRPPAGRRSQYQHALPAHPARSPGAESGRAGRYPLLRAGRPLGRCAGAKGREVTLQLTDFVIPPDDVPEDVQRAISHWSQWIDYWAVDWDNQGDTFHNMWQAYRTRQDKSLKLHTTHRYDQPGAYTIMVKVIDILGNDTTKTLRVQVT
jgi:adenine-specific DNA-methyltransferase